MSNLAPTHDGRVSFLLRAGKRCRGSGPEEPARAVGKDLPEVQPEPDLMPSVAALRSARLNHACPHDSCFRMARHVQHAAALKTEVIRQVAQHV
jgi:hypothetical protein